MDYKSALDYIDRHTNLEGGRADRFTDPAPVMPTAGKTEGLSLDAMAAFMEALGDPHLAYRTVHLTGTNGKGSTARATAALLQELGLSVALYTSPDMGRVNERIVWDGNEIPDEDFARIVDLLAEVETKLEITPSRFELLTAIAFVWFAEQGTEVAVVEVGLLGRFDATNVIESDVAVFTNIGKDHTTGGADWQHEVAAEKAGIIKPESRVVLGSPMGELRRHFDNEASASVWEAGDDFTIAANEIAVGGRVIDLHTVHGTYNELFIPFHGRHQGQNFATAVAAVEALIDREIDRELLDAAFARVELPARFEIVARNPTVAIDGAHNPDGAATATQTLIESMARTGSWVLVVGILQGKHPKEMLEAFRIRDFDAVICTQADSNRAVPADELTAAALQMGVTPETIVDSQDAITRAVSVCADDDLIFVSGSLYVAAEIRQHLLVAMNTTQQDEQDHRSSL